MKKLWIIFMSACSLGYAQIGINTTDITSTLTIQGSVSANYREITNTTYYLKQDDCNVGFTSRSNQDGVFYLPLYRYQMDDAFGRMYNIKNLTENLVLQVRTQGGKALKFGGLKVSDTSSYFLYPGQHLSVVADQNNDWVVYDYPSYVRKYTKVDDNLEGKTTVRIGDFSFRLLKVGAVGDVYLQIKSARGVNIACSTSLTYTTSSNKRGYTNVIDTRYVQAHRWTFSHQDPGAKSNPVMSYYNLLSQVSIITIGDTGEMYRVTCSGFNVGFTKYMGILVERLL
ncbi:hypothetical protein [Myroides odoratus]|uniref:hypothetical protein n=1 Tax=Myroides odoratus TaxID=256 RepID=UPI0007660AA7|nr:hypothetical protein [Myroides odoratus]